MRICICTRYHHGEPAYAALDLADVLERRGARVRLLAATPAGPRLHAGWDSRVERRAFAEAYADALPRSDAFAWTHCPTADQVAAARSAGARSYYVHSWDEAVVEDAPALSKLDGVLAPHRASHALLTGVLKLRAVRFCPWSPSPATWVRDPVVPKSPRVVIWIDGPNQYNTSDLALDELPRLLDAVPRIRATLIASGLRGQAKRRLDGLHDAYSDRLRIASPPAYDRMADVFLGCDLLVYPAQFSGFAHAPLWAGACALPTVCFDCPPFGPAAKSTRPEGVVSCKKGLTEAGLAYVVDYDPGRLYDHAARALATGGLAVDASSYANLQTRRRTYERAISEIFI